MIFYKTSPVIERSRPSPAMFRAGFRLPLLALKLTVKIGAVEDNIPIFGQYRPAVGDQTCQPARPRSAAAAAYSRPRRLAGASFCRLSATWAFHPERQIGTWRHIEVNVAGVLFSMTR